MADRALLKTRPEAYGYITLQDYTPRGWHGWGGHIVIEPVPDDVFALKLFVADFPSAALVNSTDQPTELPPEFHSCIIDFACYVLSIKLKKWKQTFNYYNIYIRNLKMRRNEYVKRKAEERTIHNIPGNVRNPLRKEIDARAFHTIPANVKYAGGQPWAH